jgi:receptor protein-tyrosine kinase
MTPPNTIQELARIFPGPGMPVAPERSMGAMLMDAGKITPEDGERILRHAREQGMRFGDAAVALKLVSQEDIAQVLARQFDYPYLRAGESRVSPEVISAWSPFTAPVEALRALRSQLLLRWFGDGERKSLAIASPGRGEGRSHLAANLAVVFSQMGERTLLIDADLRNPRQHELFGLANATGLSTVLAERADLGVVQRVGALRDLSVLTSGATPPNPLELLGRDGFQTLMDDVSANFDVVIVDTPAASLGADGQIVATRCSGALMVARKNRSLVDDCRDLADAVKASGVALVGSVVNEG